MLAVAMGIYLVLRRDDFSKRSMLAILIAGAALFFAGFIIDRSWPFHYFESLTRFRGIVNDCSICASLPILLTRMMTTTDFMGTSLLIGMIIYPLAFLIVYFARRDILRTP